MGPITMIKDPRWDIVSRSMKVLEGGLEKNPYTTKLLSIFPFHDLSELLVSGQWKRFPSLDHWYEWVWIEKKFDNSRINEWENEGGSIYS
jgi:hypothetical protein